MVIRSAPSQLALSKSAAGQSGVSVFGGAERRVATT